MADTNETVRKFNTVLDDLLRISPHFDKNQKLRSAEKEVWYRADREIKIAYLPPRTHHSGVSVPSIHVRVYREELKERVEEIYAHHGLMPEVTDHDIFGKSDIDANLQ